MKQEIKYRELSNISVGTMFDSSADFIAPSNVRHLAKPGFYLRDNLSGERFTAYLEQLNKRDIGKENIYRMIVRGIGNSFSHKGESTLIRLEQRLSVGDNIHVQVKEKTRRGEYFARFLSYRIFIPVQFRRDEEEVEILEDDCVFGRVKEIRDNATTIHFSAILHPISIVNVNRFNNNKNRVFYSA